MLPQNMMRARTKILSTDSEDMERDIQTPKKKKSNRKNKVGAIEEYESTLRAESEFISEDLVPESNHVPNTHGEIKTPNRKLSV